MMKLSKDGCEYAHWSATGAPSGVTFQVKFLHEDNTDTGWLDAEFINGQIRKLVRGAEAEDVVGAVVLPLGETNTFLRLTDTPEVVIRPGGVIVVS